jgi:integrase
MSVYKRPGSKYYWMKFWFDGELIQRTTKCKNRRDAETVESAFRTQLALGKVGIRPKKKPITFKKAAEEYLEWEKVGHAQKPASFRRIYYSTKELIDFFGSELVNRIEKKDIEKYLLARSKQKSRKTGGLITGDTINCELISLKTIFKRLVSEGYLAESPAREVRQLPKNNRTFHVLTEDEEKRYLLAAAQPLQDIATLMLETGMRPKEVYELERQRVDLDAGFVLVSDGKTDSSNRKVWLSERAAGILRARIERSENERLFPIGDRNVESLTRQINDQHTNARTAIGLSFRLYDCRHTFATRALESGVDLLTLAHMLGHASLDQVMRYAHPSESRKSDAIREMEKKRQKAV